MDIAGHVFHWTDLLEAALENKPVPFHKEVNLPRISKQPSRVEQEDVHAAAMFLLSTALGVSIESVAGLSAVGRDTVQAWRDEAQKDHEELGGHFTRLSSAFRVTVNSVEEAVHLINLMRIDLERRERADQDALTMRSHLSGAPRAPEDLRVDSSEIDEDAEEAVGVPVETEDQIDED